VTEAGRRGDAHRMLLRALRDRSGAGDAPAFGSTSGEAWASATFRGMRHMITLRFVGTDAAGRAGRMAAEMDAIEFDLPGHLVADITVTGRREDDDGVALTIEALTVEDA
jgi:hypothetical protein